MPLQNRFDVVKQIDRENPGLFREGHPFVTVVAARLAKEDTGWGRRRNKNGNLSKDVIAYNDPNGLISVDIIRGVSGSDPAIQWVDYGKVGGEFVAVEPENGGAGNGGGIDDDEGVELRILEYLAMIEGHLEAIRSHLGA